VYLNAYLFMSQSVQKEVIIGRNLYAFLIHFHEYKMCSVYHWLSCSVRFCSVRLGSVRFGSGLLRAEKNEGACKDNWNVFATFICDAPKELFTALFIFPHPGCILRTTIPIELQSTFKKPLAYQVVSVPCTHCSGP
jgi:hypothetical protein